MAILSELYFDKVEEETMDMLEKHIGHTLKLFRDKTSDGKEGSTVIFGCLDCGEDILELAMNWHEEEMEW